MAQLRDHCQNLEEQLKLRISELDNCQRREQELRRSFAQRLQSLEMMLNTSHHAFAIRERELLKQVATPSAAGTNEHTDDKSTSPII